MARAHQRALDDSQNPIYLLYTVQRWLALVLDLLVAGLAVLLIILAVEVDSDMSASDMGVALVNLTSFNMNLTYLVRFWASMETSLGAISRIRQFSEEMPKAQGSGRQGTESKPLDNTIVFGNVTAVYENPSGDQSCPAEALSSINLVVPSGSKLCITGRSGSGKSSLLSTLFRTLPLKSGTITIGGQDITLLDQEVVQTRLNAISQSTFFFPGQTLRQTLKPESLLSEKTWQVQDGGKVGDESLTEALKLVGLHQETEKRGGLGAIFELDSWSAGQLQLLGLARTIVKGRGQRVHSDHAWKILILDEATSRSVPIFHLFSRLQNVLTHNSLLPVASIRKLPP